MQFPLAYLLHNYFHCFFFETVKESGAIKDIHTELKKLLISLCATQLQTKNVRMTLHLSIKRYTHRPLHVGGK